MTTTTIIGVDPGLVHNGLVAYRIDEDHGTIEIISKVHETKDTGKDKDAFGDDVVEAIETFIKDAGWGEVHMFVESYRERANAFSTDSKMRRLVAKINAGIPRAKVLDNMGVKKIVNVRLMRLLGLTGFPSTHHQDLESAARIAIFGALKEPALNGLISRVVIDVLDRDVWDIQASHL